MNYPGTGAPGYNTFHVRTPGGVVEDENALLDLQGILQDFYQALTFEVAESTSFSHDGVWTGVGPDVGLYYDLTGFGYSGNQGTDRAPDLLCLNLSWGTAGVGRQRRGRTFVGPLARNVIDSDGRPSPTARQRTLDTANDLVDASTGLANGAFGTWSLKDGVLRDWVSADVGDRFAYLSTRRD